ncbi:MAG: flagellar hook-associated protein FlgK [Planctomycetota bacterium]
MGLSAALNTGKSGLLAHQAAIQVTGNNLANAATPGYKRRTVELAPARDQKIDATNFVGTGVNLTRITREVNESLEARLRSAITDENGSATTQELLARIEAVQGELSDIDLSTRLSEYFGAWSQLATNPQDSSLRTLVIQEANDLTAFIKDLRDSYGQLETQTVDQLGLSVRAADDVLGRIEELNRQITEAEAGRGDAGSLRDQRDQLLAELSTSLDITTYEQDNGQINVFVGSTPIVLNGESRGLELRSETLDDGTVQQFVVVREDGTRLNTDNGDLGAQVAFRNGALNDAVEALDRLAASLVFETNKLHSESQGLALRNSYTSSVRVADPTLALNDTDPVTKLEFLPQHGSFQIHTTSNATGIRQTSTINVDLDGIGGPDATLTDLAASINAVSGVTATVSADGRLTIAGDTADTLVSFTDDTSNVLASLGINGFFEGSDAFDISVSADVAADPRLLAVAREHLSGDNRGALAIAGLADTSIEDLNGNSITEHWRAHVEDVSVTLSRARDQREADGIVRENLQTQQAALSGVNADEEAINLLQYQRAYQANARFISVVDELMQTLINLV